MGGAMAAIELRPLSLGELLDHTFSYYRKYFLLFVGIMALPQVLMVAVSVLIQSLRMTTPIRPAPKDPAQVFAQFPALITGFLITMVIFMVASIVIYSLVHGATAYALSEVHLGRQTTIANAFHSLRGKVWRLLDVVVSVTVRIMGVFILMMSAVGVSIGIIGALSVGGKPDPVLIIFFLLFMLAAMAAAAVLGCFLMMRYALVVPALVLENITARQAIKRSVALAKGNFWRIFLTFMLMYLISTSIISICQGPFWVAMFVIGIKNGVMPLWLSLPMTISGGIGGAVSGPLMVIALTLLYFDARVRKEGFDLQLMMANLQQERPGSAMPPEIAPTSPQEPAG